jgi:iron complex outermembrane receptor protein
VYQVGYRATTAGVLTWSVAAFRHDWSRLRSATAPPAVFIENKIFGPVYGFEGWIAWQALDILRISGGATGLRKDLRLEADSTDAIGPDNPALANDPEEQWLLRSSFTPWRGHEIDATLRYVAELPTPVVPAYTALDLRYAWRVHPRLEISVLGQNLTDRRHPEFNAAPGRSEFSRGMLVTVKWRQ